VTNYEWPHQLKDGSMVYLKNAYNELRFLVQLKDGQENQLTPIGTVTETYLSVNNNRAAWTEMSTDPRWQNKNYNDIITYDFNTNKRKKLTCKTKLFSPEFSSAGDKLVAVKADEQLNNKLVFIDTNTGKETISIENPDNLFLCYPHWTKDDQCIVYIAKKQSQVAIIKYDINKKISTELTPWSHHVIGAMYIGKDRVYYNASYSGINNIYAVELNGNKEIKQITSVKISAEMPNLSADETTLFMSEFDVMGFKITSQLVQLEQAKSVTITEPAEMDVFKIKTTTHEKNILDNVPSQVYVKKNYRGLIRDPKLHSWGITGLTVYGSGNVISQGTLQVDNVLNDFSLAVTGGLNTNENTWNTNARLSYARFYLPFYIEGVRNQRRWKEGDLHSNHGLTSTEEMIGGGVGLPLSWIRGPWRTSVKLQTGIHQIITSHYIDNAGFKGYNFTSGSASLEFSNLLQKAKQHVASRFGQSLSVYYNKSISSAIASRFTINGAVYFPGIGKNHSISVSASYKKEAQSNAYDYADVFEHARGFRPGYPDEEAVLRTNYQLPLIYPDAGFGGIIYLQRVRLNLFMDSGSINYTDGVLQRTFLEQSVGSEFLFDIDIFNVLPLSIGVRYAVPIDREPNTKYIFDPWKIYLAGSF
jgi:hypothetical protein